MAGMVGYCCLDWFDYWELFLVKAKYPVFRAQYSGFFDAVFVVDVFFGRFAFNCDLVDRREATMAMGSAK